MSTILPPKKTRRGRATSKPAVVRLMGRKFALVPLEEWTALNENHYLLENPASAARLMEGVNQVREKKTHPVSLKDLRARVNDHA